MNCRTAKKQMLARLDEVLSGEQEAALQQHVKTCLACARAAQENDLAHRWLQEASPAGPSENFEWRLKLRLSELDRSGARLPLFDETPVRRRWTLRFAVSAAAAAALVLSVGLTRISTDQPVDGSATVQSDPAPRGPRLVDPTPVQSTPSLAQPHSGLPQVRQWPRPVPVRYGPPLGPEYPPTVAPSILGPVRADSDTIEPQPLRAAPQR